MPHMKCVCFLQSSDDSLDALQLELKEPKYGEYYLCQSVNHQLFVASAITVLIGLRCRFQQHLEQVCH